MTVFVFAHGAGGHKNDRGMEALTKILEHEGISVIRFNFPYRDRGSKRPDPMPVLKAKMREVMTQASGRPLLIGGRSMGGRVATMLAAEGVACDGLLLFAYPLHPAGQPEKLRDAHLPKIQVPVLCFNGTRDPLCTQSLMNSVVERLAPLWTMHWLQGAGHSFQDKVLGEIGVAIAKWVRSYRF